MYLLVILECCVVHPNDRGPLWNHYFSVVVHWVHLEAASAGNQSWKLLLPCAIHNDYCQPFLVVPARPPGRPATEHTKTHWYVVKQRPF